MQNFLGDDTPLGELVDWINQDINFPKDVTSQKRNLDIFSKSSMSGKHTSDEYQTGTSCFQPIH